MGLYDVIRIIFFKQCSTIEVTKITSKHWSLACGFRAFSSASLDYSEDENTKILESINKKSKDDLLRYHLSKGRAQRLEDWKLKNGSFKSIKQILQLDGFGVKITKKFCQSLLENTPRQNEKLTKSRYGQFTYPIVSADLVRSCKSCVSLHIGVASVSWARLEINRTSPCLLTHWQNHDILDKKMNIHDIVLRSIYLDKLIPEADCYVLEAPQTAQPGSPGNAEQVNINVQKAQLTAILSFALCKRSYGDCENVVTHSNLFYLKRFLASRLFRTLVGTERVSTEQAVMDLLRTHYNLDNIPDETSENVAVSPLAGEVIAHLDLREIYKSSEGYQRDFLGQSLLVGLAFVRLCLLKCPKSLAIIVGKSK